MGRSTCITRYHASLVATLVALTIAITLVPSPTEVASAQAAASGCSYTGNLNTPRDGHIATLLPDGKVLVVGGSNTTSAELYDPSTGTWSFTGNLNVVHESLCAALLPNGKVLVVGGGSAELYDPATGTFTLTGNLIEQASCHTATLLTNGKVLITASLPESPLVEAITELYDPSTGTFSLTGRFVDTGVAYALQDLGLVDAPAILLHNGKVLFAGEPRAELYDPVSGTFSLTGVMTTGNFGEPPNDISGRTATLLMNGKVLVTGGMADSRLTSAELYDPATGTFTATGDMTRDRDFHAVTLLRDGRVLITGAIPTWEATLPAAQQALRSTILEGHFSLYWRHERWANTAHGHSSQQWRSSDNWWCILQRDRTTLSNPCQRRALFPAAGCRLLAGAISRGIDCIKGRHSQPDNQCGQDRRVFRPGNRNATRYHRHWD